MKIAFIGQKGIPATFGGVEYHVDELASRLAKRGHEVTVYVRSWYTPGHLKDYKGIRLVNTPTIQSKHLDAFVHSFTSSIDTVFKDYDIVHYHALGPTFFSWIPLLFGKKVVSTIHRLDWQAGKWAKPAKAFLKLTEQTAVYIPTKTVVVSQSLKEYIESKYKREAIYIPNGVSAQRPLSPNVITAKYDLKGDDYILFMGRLVPEKRVDWVIKAFNKIKENKTGGNLKLVVAGGSSATDEYVKYLTREAHGKRDIIFTGYVTGQEKAELLSNAFLFLLPSYLEGNPIALLEAMSYGISCLVSDIAPHKEVVTDEINGFLFKNDDFDDLTSKYKILLQRRPDRLKKVAEEGMRYVGQNFDWETVVDRIEQVYHSVL